MLFSSITAVLGNIGQCDYAYANGFMDSFSAYREKLRENGYRHGKTISINWPLWAAGGMHIDNIMEQNLKDTMGLLPLETAAGIAAFDYAIQQKSTQLIAFSGEKKVFEHVLHPVIPTISATNDHEQVKVQSADSDLLKNIIHY